MANLSAHKTLNLICRLADRAYATTEEEEAFSAPLVFVDVGAFYDSHNGERNAHCPFRKLQTAGLNELRDASLLLSSHLNDPILLLSSVAARNTNSFHSSIGIDFSNLPYLFLAFRQLVLGKESKANF